jgi:hypothetical protein
MDKLAGIGQLAHDIAAAAACGDWQAVAAADAAIATMLATMLAAPLAAPQAGVDPTALLALRAAHAGAREQCTVATNAAAAQVAAMQAGREGWIAYALDSNSNLDGSPA